MYVSFNKHVSIVHMNSSPYLDLVHEKGHKLYKGVSKGRNPKISTVVLYMP